MQPAPVDTYTRGSQILLCCHIYAMEQVSSQGVEMAFMGREKEQTDSGQRAGVPWCLG
jgi:hypothetical protein